MARAQVTVAEFEPETSARAVRHVRPKRQRTGEKPRILIIDDEPAFAAMVKMMLEGTGHYDVLTESEGKRALAAARDFCPDLVLLDIIMPDIGGTEVAAKFREAPDMRRTPVIFLTALVTRNDIRFDSEPIGGHYFLPKPVDKNELIDMIESQLAA
jgi:two-component system sensor histidine kinase/response regulator